MRDCRPLRMRDYRHPLAPVAQGNQVKIVPVPPIEAAAVALFDLLLHPLPPDHVVVADGFERAIPVKKIAAGTFRGRLPIGLRQGLFRVRTVDESRAFPEAGLYRPEAELADYVTLNSQFTRLQDTRLPLAQQKVAYQLASYQGGKADLTAVLVARRELIEVQLMQLDLQNRRDVAAATIYYSYLESAP